MGSAPDPLRAGIARVLTAQGRTAGTAFAVSEHQALTCAHVVQTEESQERGQPPPDRVTLVFSGGAAREAAVEVFSRSEDRDVAVLHIEGGIPEGTAPLLLGGSSGTRGHRVCTFGFPWPDESEGLPGEAVVLGATTRDGHPALILQSGQIDSGFSGAPLWDEARRRVIGMAAAVLHQGAWQHAGTLHAIPAESLRELCPALRVNDVCPYQGLDAFGEDSAQLFFGRRRVTERLLSCLRRQQRALVVLGPSGSGKSSVVRAGLVPALQRGALQGSDRWGTVITRPAEDPFAQLAGLGLLEADHRGASLEAGVAAWLLRHPQHERLLLVLDQFEELLVTCPGPLRSAFVEQLLALVGGQQRVTVVLVMRNDFYSALAEQAPLLLESVEDSLKNVLGALFWDELREIIREPARGVGLALDEALVHQIACDALAAAPCPALGERAVRSTVLPLLEFALTELWQRQHEGGELTLGGYHDMGGLSGALGQWADRACGDLRRRGLETTTRQVLTRLVHLGDPAQDLPDSRQRRPLALLGRGPQDRAQVSAVVQALSQARLVVTDADPATGQGRVELIHDALLREWPSLQRWLAEDRRFLLWQQHLSHQVRLWESGGRRDPARLLRGRELAEAASFCATREADLTDVERAFLRAGRLRAAGWRLLAAGLLLLGLGGTGALWRIVARGARQAQAAAQADQLQLAAALALQQGREIEALGAAVSALGPELQRGGVPDQQAAEVLRTALLAARRSLPLQGHTDTVWDAAFSPDGARVVTTSRDRTARLWDPRTGRALAVLRGHTDDLNQATFSPDGRRVVTTSVDGTARLWDANTGQALAVLRGHTGLVWTAAFSPDGAGARVVTASRDGTARLWDAATGKPLLTLRGHAGALRQAVFSPDGRALLTAGEDGTARIWDAATGAQLLVLTGHHGMVWSPSFSPDGARVLTLGEDRTARVWDARTGRALLVLTGYPAAAHAGRFSPDGALIITGGTDGTARIWDARGGALLHTLRGHGDQLIAAAFSPDGRRALTAGLDSTARVWDVRSGEAVAVLRGHGGGVTSAAFSDDGALVVTASTDRTARVWDVATGHSVVALHPPGEGSRSARFSPDGALVVTQAGGAPPVVWDATSGAALASPTAATEWAGAPYFAPDSRRLVAADRDGTARIWEARSGKLLGSIGGIQAPVRMAEFSPDRDGARLVTVGADGSARIWDARTGEPGPILAAGGIWRATFSPDADGDGARVLTCGKDGSARIWDGRTGASLATLAGRGGRLWWAAFSRDGRRVITTGDGGALLWDARGGPPLMTAPGLADAPWHAELSPDGALLLTLAEGWQVRVWDTAGGRPVSALRGHALELMTGAFSPDGKLVVTTSDDSTARVWEARSGRALLVLEEHSGPLLDAMFSPDGGRVLTTGSDGTVRIFPVRPSLLPDGAAEVLRLACDLLSGQPGYGRVRPWCEQRAVLWR